MTWKNIYSTSDKKVVSFKNVWLKKLKDIKIKNQQFYYFYPNNNTNLIEEEYERIIKGIKPTLLSTNKNYMNTPFLLEKNYLMAFKSAIINMDDTYYFIPDKNTPLFKPNKFTLTNHYLSICLVLLSMLIYGMLVDNKKKYLINCFIIFVIIIALFFTYLIY